MLPQDRGNIRRRAFQTLMAAHQCTVAQIQTLIKDLPKLIHITAGRTCDIYEIECHDTLIKSAVIFMPACLIITRICDIADTCIRKTIRCQEAAASHTCIYIALFQLTHDLLRNIIRHHTLCRTLCGDLCQIEIFAVFMDIVLFQRIDQLRECRGDIDTTLIFHASDPLVEHLFNDHREIIPAASLRDFIQIHKHRHKRSLSIRCHQ